MPAKERQIRYNNSMKSRSKRNRKRTRGGIGCLVGDGESDDNSDEKSPSSSSLLRTEVVPLSRAFEIIIAGASRDEERREITCTNKNIVEHERRVRIIYPYPFTFATFAKARWVGKTVADIYHEEFGSYPRSYYEAAIKAGRILVSGRKVNCDYKIKGGDELSHTVHRHEPAVGLADTSSDDPVRIVYEDDMMLAVDKPATLPIHPCGGYNFNSLLEILSHWKPDSFGPGNLFTVHRLDRLTSGLVLIAKSSALARSLGNCIMERDGCEKVYLARVKGQFPLGLEQVSPEIVDSDSPTYHPWEFRYSPPDCEGDIGDREMYPNKRPKHAMSPPCQYGELNEFEVKSWKGGLLTSIVTNDGDQKNKSSKSDFASDESKSTQSYAGLGYWMTHGSGVMAPRASLRDLITQCEGVNVEEMLQKAMGSTSATDKNIVAADQSLLWLNFACPCRIASPKNGVCEAGDFADLKDQNDRKGIKPAQTSFALLSYDPLSDSSLVLAKPVTGRTHQIRLHLQKLGHPIANDHCYGGQLWFGDEEGKKVCCDSRKWLDLLDRGSGKTSDGDDKVRVAPENSTNADTPATEAEIYHAAADRSREDGESILDFIQKTCVWCARCRGADGCIDGLESKQNESSVFRRTLMEYLVRSQGIWLHALQYRFKAQDETGRNKSLQYTTGLPPWAK